MVDAPKDKPKADTKPAVSPREDMRQKAIEEQKKAIADRKSADDAAVKAEPEEYVGEGYDETKPGQTEIVAGTPEHQRLLNAYPNATSYSEDTNVVVPDPVEDGEGEGGPPAAPVNVDVPYVQQEGADLTCTMGNWQGEPTSYAYKWMRDGTNVSGATSAAYTTLESDVGKSFTCTVTATNAMGETVAPPSNAVVVTATKGKK